jgi:hypothetical protein
MRRNALFKVLFAAFLLYLALPSIQEISSSISSIFWASWIVFFLLVVGANLGVLMNVKTRKSVELSQEGDKVFLKQN